MVLLALNYLLAGFYTRAIQKIDKLLLFPRLFSFFLALLFLAFFSFLAIFTLACEKNRVCEGKKINGSTNLSVTTEKFKIFLKAFMKSHLQILVENENKNE